MHYVIRVAIFSQGHYVIRVANFMQGHYGISVANFMQGRYGIRVAKFMQGHYVIYLAHFHPEFRMIPKPRILVKLFPCTSVLYTDCTVHCTVHCTVQVFFRTKNNLKSQQIYSGLRR